MSQANEQNDQWEKHPQSIFLSHTFFAKKPPPSPKLEQKTNTTSSTAENKQILSLNL